MTSDLSVRGKPLVKTWIALDLSFLSATKFCFDIMVQLHDLIEPETFLFHIRTLVSWEEDKVSWAEVQWWGLTTCIKHFWTPSQKAEAALPAQPEPLAETAPPAVHVNVGALSAKDLPVTLPRGDFSHEAGSLFPASPELAHPPPLDPNQSGQPGSESKVPR